MSSPSPVLPQVPNFQMPQQPVTLSPDGHATNELAVIIGVWVMILAYSIVMNFVPLKWVDFFKGRWSWKTFFRTRMTAMRVRVDNAERQAEISGPMIPDSLKRAVKQVAFLPFNLAFSFVSTPALLRTYAIMVLLPYVTEVIYNKVIRPVIQRFPFAEIDRTGDTFQGLVQNGDSMSMILSGIFVMSVLIPVIVIADLFMPNLTAWLLGFLNTNHFCIVVVLSIVCGTALATLHVEGHRNSAGVANVDAGRVLRNNIALCGVAILSAILVFPYVNRHVYSRSKLQSERSTNF